MKAKRSLRNSNAAFLEGNRQIQQCVNTRALPAHFRRNFVRVNALADNRSSEVMELDDYRFVFWCIAFPYSWWRPRNQMSEQVFRALLYKVKRHNSDCWPREVERSLADLQREFPNFRKINAHGNVLHLAVPCGNH